LSKTCSVAFSAAKEAYRSRRIDEAPVLDQAGQPGNDRSVQVRVLELAEGTETPAI
jgi:hypothetical protein